MVEAYCRKCKKKTEQVNSEVKETKKGMKFSKGKCKICGSHTITILPKEKK